MKNTLIKKPSIADLKLFLNLFQGREGVFARQWTGGQGYSPVRPERPINVDDILLHIQGAETYGIYPIQRHNTVRLVCFDVDLPKNFAEVEEDALVTDKGNLLPQIKNICTTALDVFRHSSFNSKGMLIEDTGGRGYHVWFFFESPIPAADARKFAYFILRKAKVQCEVFPKQNEVAEGQYGNLIKLPLGLHKKYRRYSNFINITQGKILSIKEPFAHLAEIVPIPISIIFKIIKEAVKDRDLEPTRPRETNIPAEVVPKQITGKLAKSPQIGHLIEKCRAFSNLKKKAVMQHHLEHPERLALAYIMINIEDGEEILHQIFSNCSDYDTERTQKEIDYLKARGMKPISCRRLIEQGICDKFCRSEIRQQSMDPNCSEPSPIRFALWKDLTEPESIWETDTLSFENIYKKSNLYRAWEQVKDYAKVNEAFFDMHAFEYFEEHLEENIETLRFELRNHIYSPAPYRWYQIPKERKGNDFEYRRMAFLHPRDYVIIQSIINIIGPIFEKSFSNNSCLGYRLDTEGKAGNSIFYRWQSAWQRRKKGIKSFLYHPKHFHYIKADILHFYDKIDRVILYNKILDKIGSATETCQIIRSFLENRYIDDSNGEEKICSPPSKGIPQGPAFSAFFANIYLNELDHLIEKKSFDYVRYVDDMVILCMSKEEVEDIRKFLDDYLSSINLELNLDKTIGPCSVTNSEPLLDFLGEMKYGMAGLFVREPYVEELLSPQFLKTKLDYLLGIRELNIYNLEEISKHLSYYLRMRERIEPKLDNLAIELSKKVLAEYPLKPHHLVIILEVLSRKQVDISTVISRCQCSYAKTVLCIVLTTLKEIPPWAESFLTDSIEDRSSYILRGTAYSVLSKLHRGKYPRTVVNVISQEKSPYVVDRSLDCLITIRGEQSERAKTCFLELVKRHLKGSLNKIVKVTIKWGDGMLDNLIKKQMMKIDRVNPADLYIILEFIFIICPDDFEELLLTFFSKDKAVLMYQLLFSSMDEIRKTAAKRRYLAFAHQLAIYERVKNLKADWLRDTLVEAIDEWRVGTAELSPSTGLRDVNYWLADGDPSKKYQMIQNLSSKEHRRQGGYQSLLVRDQETNKNFVLEAVEEDILKEYKIIGTGVREEDIKDQLEPNRLSTLSDCFHNVEGGKKYYWFKYVIPDGYDILYSAYNKRERKTKFHEQEVLNIASSLFNQVELIKQHIGIEPVVNPYTVILGEGNQVQLINLFFGIPRKLYISTHNNSMVDTSATTNALFNGFLSYELITSKCPIEIYKKLQLRVEPAPRLMSDYLPDTTMSFHFAWILDRLCYPTSPPNRYTSLSTLKRDIECLRKFTSYFQDKKLAHLPREKKYWSGVLDVLSLRVARFLKLPDKIHNSIHENVIDVFRLSAHCVAKALANYHNGSTLDFSWGSESLTLKNRLNNRLHEAGYKCDLFARGIRQKIISIFKITQWPIAPSIPAIILYIPFKLELVALVSAIGLFEIHDKVQIKKAMVRIMQSQGLSRERIMDISLKNFLTTSRIIKIFNLMNQFINKRFQDALEADGSDIALLALVTLVLLKNQRELWEQWCTCIGLSKKINLTKAVKRLKYITENCIEMDGLVAKFIGEPLEKTFEDTNALMGLYDSCLQDIVKLRRIIRINRKRTFVARDFHHLEREVVVKFGRKEKSFSHDLIIPFPRCYETIWRKESITIDSLASGKNNKITSLSLTPTRLKKIIGWRYESLFRRGWNWVRKYSRRSLWRIISIGLFLVGGVLISKHAATGMFLLALGSLLLTPLVEEWYWKRHKSQKI